MPYSYTVVDLDSSSSDRLIEEKLNSYGSDSWRVVDVQDIGDRTTRYLLEKSR